MGIFSFLLSAFKFRRKQTTQEKLQHIDEQIESLRESSKLNEQRQKSAVLYLTVFSVTIYLSSIFVFYLWYFPVRWDQRVLYSLPFLLFPFIIIGLSRLLHKVYGNRRTVNADAVKELKKAKKKILENVMDTETYKVAKELLQKYDPHRSLVEESESPLKPLPPKTPDGQELRKRNVQSAPVHTSKLPPQPQQASQSNGFPPATPTTVVPRPPALPSNGAMPAGPMRVAGGAPMIRGPVQRCAPIAPILPRERSVFDKVCDYVIGDGPNNRFALICKQCCGHNGMVLSEEFQFTSYRCCYCGFFNPARLKRMSAPKLPSRPRPQNNRSSATESANSTDTESTKTDETHEDKEKEKEKLTITEKGEVEGDETTDDVSRDTNDEESLVDDTNTTTEESEPMTVDKPETMEANGEDDITEGEGEEEPTTTSAATTTTTITTDNEEEET